MVVEQVCSRPSFPRGAQVDGDLGEVRDICSPFGGGDWPAVGGGGRGRNDGCPRLGAELYETGDHAPEVFARRPTDEGRSGEELRDLLYGDQPYASPLEYPLYVVNRLDLLSLGEGADEVDALEGVSRLEAGALDEVEQQLHVEGGA